MSCYSIFIEDDEAIKDELRLSPYQFSNDEEYINVHLKMKKIDVNNSLRKKPSGIGFF